MAIVEDNCGILRHATRGYKDIIYTEDLEEFLRGNHDYLLCTTAETINEAMRTILECLMSSARRLDKKAFIHCIIE